MEVTAAVSPGAYWPSVALAALCCALVCRAGRRHPGPWRPVVARLIGALLLSDAVSYAVGEALAGTWSAKTSLPLALCDVGVLVAALACWWRVPVLVELTYFWGLAGTLQAVVTPDLNVGFPHLVFFQYVVGHLAIVLAALFLVVGMGMAPRPGAVPRVFALTALYTALVGLVDGLTGANYMFLRAPPGEWTLLRVLGPWPWYTLSAAGVAVVLMTLLDLPFWRARPPRRRLVFGPWQTARTTTTRSTLGRGRSH
ncbi:MAG TPA: TIGR02206 family membrane protein [Acidimicrobiales bacterium]|nr:TIGR02206 family membrane protein [Acidimicrobiales bacterium]